MRTPDNRDQFTVRMTAQPLEDEEHPLSVLKKEIFSRKWLIRFALIALGFIGGRLSTSQKPDRFLAEKDKRIAAERKLCENELQNLRPVIERMRARNSLHSIPDCHAAFIDLLLAKHGLGALEHAFHYTTCAPAEYGQMEHDVMVASLEYGRLCE